MKTRTEPKLVVIGAIISTYISQYYIYIYIYTHISNTVFVIYIYM